MNQKSDLPNILGIITARGGSKGIPRKNLKLLCGKPLIYYTIKIAKESKMLTRVILSSDDNEIIEISRRYGIDVPFIRPKELARDETPHLPVVLHALNFVEKEEGKKYDYIAILQPTNPLRKAGDIDGALIKLIETGADSVITYFKVEDLHPLWMSKIIDDRVYPLLEVKNKITRRQELPPVYMRSGAVYAVSRDTIKNKSSLYGEDQRPYIIPWWRGRNIDESWEFALAEILLEWEKNGLLKA
mgnify:CR=1 FL=1